MCGRYFLEESPEMRPIVEAMNRAPLASVFRQRSESLSSYGEIRPTQVVPVIASNKNGYRTVFPMKWGYGAGRHLLINARTETAALKPAFRDSWAHHRCVIPASWYYEWEHIPAGNGRMKTGDKFRLKPRDASMIWLCGLYRMEAGLPRFVILTREPADAIRFIHDRMPLMLPEAFANEWIRSESNPEELLSAAETRIQYEQDEKDVKRI